MTTAQRLDRPAAIRRALRDIVAENGFHGTSMGAVAKRAGVATGTAYVHYESKDELVFATYLEIKQELGEAVLAQLDRSAPPRDRYAQLFTAAFRHLREEPERAGFLAQMETSPYHGRANELLAERGDALAEEAGREDLVGLLVDLPMDVLYSFSIGLIARLANSGISLSEEQLDTVVESSWRAITR